MDTKLLGKTIMFLALYPLFDDLWLVTSFTISCNWRPQPRHIQPSHNNLRAWDEHVSYYNFTLDIFDFFYEGIESCYVLRREWLELALSVVLLVKNIGTEVFFLILDTKCCVPSSYHIQIPSHLNHRRHKKLFEYTTSIVNSHIC